MLTPHELEGDRADCVLVDAPCSGLGILGSRPDARWHREQASQAELHELQSSLLKTAISLTRPGGIIVWSTCTLLKAENEDIVEPFLRAGSVIPVEALDPVTTLVGSPTGEDDDDGVDLPFIRTWPHRHGTDGFSMIVLQRPNS
jgi:16S rRNA (cytosine967-C5)-methyltransferase